MNLLKLPANPPTVNKNTNPKDPKAHNNDGDIGYLISV